MIATLLLFAFPMQAPAPPQAPPLRDDCVVACEAQPVRIVAGSSAAVYSMGQPIVITAAPMYTTQAIRYAAPVYGAAPTFAGSCAGGNCSPATAPGRFGGFFRRR